MMKMEKTWNPFAIFVYYFKSNAMDPFVICFIFCTLFLLVFILLCFYPPPKPIQPKHHFVE